MKKLILTVAVLVLTCSVADAGPRCKREGGPVRNLINAVRPGILVPKNGGSVVFVPTTVREPAGTFVSGPTVFASGSSCATGKCPLK